LAAVKPSNLEGKHQSTSGNCSKPALFKVDLQMNCPPPFLHRLLTVTDKVRRIGYETRAKVASSRTEAVAAFLPVPFARV
jgi:hypothetical protein